MCNLGEGRGALKNSVNSAMNTKPFYFLECIVGLWDTCFTVPDLKLMTLTTPEKHTAGGSY